MQPRSEPRNRVLCVHAMEFLVWTKGWGDEQDRFGAFPSSNRTEKVPPAGGGVAPCKQCPRIIKHYAPITKASRQSTTSPAEALPLPPFCYAFPVLLFLPFCIDRTRRAFNRIQSKQKREQAKRETDKHKHKQKSRSGYYIKIPSKEKQTQKDHQDKQSNIKAFDYKQRKESQARQREKQERSPKSI